MAMRVFKALDVSFAAEANRLRDALSVPRDGELLAVDLASEFDEEGMEAGPGARCRGPARSVRIVGSTPR